MPEDSEKRFHSIMDKLFQTPKPKNLASPSGTQLSTGQKRGHSIFTASAAKSNSREDLVEGLKRSAGPAVSSQPPVCRPWDRGDLLRRLATFKSMKWFGKPKAVSAVNCARRGWINIEMDIIACETCGARLLFSTPSSWSQQQVEKAAAVFSLKLESGHKLLCPWIDNACDETLAYFPPMSVPDLVEGYRERSAALLRLSSLPIISSSAVDYMKSPLLERFLEGSTILEPGIRSADTSIPENISNEFEGTSDNLYFQAQKLISLCGWEPRSLPYVVDCEGQSTQSAKDVHLSMSSRGVENGHNRAISVHPSAGDEKMEVDDPSSIVLDCRLCGASVGLWAFATILRPLEVFKLDGYSDVNSQNDSMKSGQTVISGFIETPRIYDLVKENHAVSGVEDTGCNDAVSPMGRSLCLNLTIAGGPTPTKQNFKAKISLPIISRHLRAEISSNPDFRSHILPGISCVNQETSGLLNGNSFLQDQDHNGDYLSGQTVPPEAIESSKCKANDVTNQMSLEGSISQEIQVIESKNKDETSCAHQEANKMADRLRIENEDDREQNKTLSSGQNKTLLNDTENGETINQASEVSIASQVRESSSTTSHTNGIAGNEEIIKDSSLTMVADNGCNQQGDEDLAATEILHKKVTSQATFQDSPCCESRIEASIDVDNTGGTDPGSDKGPDAHKLSNHRLNNQDVREAGDRMQSSVNNEVVKAHVLGKDRNQVQLNQAMEFNPIMHHRYFCPWIESTGSSVPGWRLTLSALDRQKESSHPFSTDPCPSSSTFKVDDPVASIRRLFMSPSAAKRMKLTRGSS